MFACGRYEGIDQRVVDDAARRMRVEEVSIGDYVLPGGESAALVMIEAVVRLLPDVLGNPASHQRRFAFRSGVCWKGPATPGPPAGADSTCRECCSPVITPRSRRGGAEQALRAHPASARARAALLGSMRPTG